MKRFNLVDQIIFMPLYELIKDNYIFSLGAHIYNSFNNDKKLKDGDIESKQLLTGSKTQFFRKIIMSM